MSIDQYNGKRDMIPIKLNGRNYMGWSFHLKHFVEGQGLSMYQDGTIPKATEEKHCLLGVSK